MENKNTLAHVTSIIMFVLTGIITLYLFIFLIKMSDLATDIEFIDNIEESIIHIGAFFLIILDAITFALGLILRMLAQGCTVEYNHTNNPSDSNEKYAMEQKTKANNDSRLKI